MLTTRFVAKYNLPLAVGVGLPHRDPGAIPRSFDVSVVPCCFCDLRIGDDGLLNRFLLHDYSYLTCIQPSNWAGGRQPQ